MSLCKKKIFNVVLVVLVRYPPNHPPLCPRTHRHTGIKHLRVDLATLYDILDLPEEAEAARTGECTDVHFGTINIKKGKPITRYLSVQLALN